MGNLKTAIAVTALVASIAVPSLASAETVVPPGNSAATQYTETFPTTGGNAEVNSSLGGGGNEKGGGRSADEVLGSRTANTLEAQGPEGQAVAELATESAPAPAPETSQGGSGGSSGGGGAGKAGKGGGNAAQGGGSGSAGVQAKPAPSLAEQASSGSSGLDEVFSQAFGSSSGTMGIFLPLVLVLALVWAIAYVWRRRQPDQAAS